MFSVTINIRKKLPVINGFVSIPDGQQFLRTKLTPIDVLALIPGSSLIRMGGRGSNLATIQILDPTSLTLNGFSRSQERLFIELPDYDRLEGPPEDWFATLRSVAGLI